MMKIGWTIQEEVDRNEEKNRKVNNANRILLLNLVLFK